MKWFVKVSINSSFYVSTREFSVISGLLRQTDVNLCSAIPDMLLQILKCQLMKRVRIAH